MSLVYAASSSDFATDKIDPTFWCPYESAGVAAYSGYNLSSDLGINSGTKYLGPQQAFWMKNRSVTTKTLTLLQSARLHNPSTLKSLSTNYESDVLRLSITAGAVSDEMVVAFRENGTVDLNVLDSEKRLNTGVMSANIYSLVTAKATAINVQPLIDLEAIIPLGFNLGANAAGSYTFNATNIGGFDAAYDVFLEDLPNGVTYNLRDVGSVTVTLPAGVTHDRFVLRFAPSSNGVPTVLPNTKDESESNDIMISQLGNEALVQIPGEIDEQARIELYGVEGQLIRVKKGVSKSTKIQLPEVKAVYVIRVVNGSKVHSARVVSLGK